MTPGERAPLPDGGALAFDLDVPAGGPTDPPLLLIRPLGGTRALWGPFRAALERPTLAYDHRGTGGSSALPVGATTRALARDAAALLDHLAIDRADVFGLSLGGMVATWLAIDWPSRVGRLILASTPARGVDLSIAGAGKALALASCLLRPPAEAEACLALRVLSHVFRARHPERLAGIAAAARVGPASHRARLGLLAASARHDARRAAGRIRAPTLVLSGSADHLVSAEGPRHLAAVIAGARLRAIEGAGHDLTLEASAETAAAVTAFLAESSTDVARAR